MNNGGNNNKGNKGKDGASRFVLLRLRLAERRLSRQGAKGGNKWLRRDLIFPTGRGAVCRGMAVGMFWACAPMPMQMVPAFFCCYLWRANMVLALVCVWLSNPFTYLPVFYVEYRIGRRLFGGGEDFDFAAFEALWDDAGGVPWAAVFDGILTPLLQGAVVLAFTMAAVGYLFGFVVHGFLLRHRRR